MIYTVIDIETTGMSALDVILEVGYARIDTSGDIKYISTLHFWQPEFKQYMNERASRIHKLYEDFLSQYENEFDANLARLFTLTHNMNVIGKHSDSFDIPRIVRFMKRFTPLAPVFEIIPGYDVERLLTNHYRDWYFNKTGQHTKKLGTLEEQAVACGITKDEIQETLLKYAKDVPEERKTGFHSAAYDVATTCLLWQYALKNDLIQL